MKTFHTGDRVRLLHSSGSGTVMGRNAQGHVRVMLDDGFEVPVIDKDLALVHHDEQQAFKEKTQAYAGGIAPRQEPVTAAPGLFLALSQTLAGGQSRELYLLNNGSRNVAGAIGYNKAGTYQTEHVFSLEAKRHLLLAQLTGPHLAERPVFQVWALLAAPGQKAKPEALHTAWHLPADFAQRPYEKAPLVGKACLLHQLDHQPPAAEADPTVLLDKWTSGAPGYKAPATKLKPTAKEIDLHIEQLSPAAASLSSAEILQIQLTAFTEHLDRAIACGQEEITFIHGVGNGTLRQQLHRALTQRKTDIQFFEDHQKERLGFGATRVRLR